MIKKINKIKKFGIFDGFKWLADLPEFNKFNILYGWNWTGKTTLSRIFQCYEFGTFDKDFPDSEFELELNNGLKLNHQNLNNTLKIRVFNKLFINENIFWEGSAQPIYFIGKENIALQEEIEKLSAKKKSLGDKILKLKEELRTSDKERKKISVDTAKTIKDILTTSLNDKYRFYDKSNFHNYIRNNKEKLNEPDHLILTDDEFKNYKRSIARESKESLDERHETKLDVSRLIFEVNDTLSKSITSSSIKKLTEDWEINNWIKEGLNIHNKRSSLICEFCGQQLPEGLISTFEAHFNDEYHNFLNGIETLILQIKNKKINLDVPDPSRLYLDFKKEFTSAKNTLEKVVKDANKELDKIIEKLISKKQNPFQKYKISENEIDAGKFDQLYESGKTLNYIILKHNNLTDNFDSEIIKSKEKLESHFITEVLNDYLKIQNNIDELDSEIKRKEQEIENCKNTISEKEKDLLDHRIPADTINNLLKMYFGREEIRLEVADDGYHIKRDKDLAKNLSEGEKTAIAFSYFITKLQEKDFDLCNGIVVIDDPVSSLDVNALFQAFAFMKNACKDAGQLFILTHNYDFFRQIKNWFTYINKMKPREQGANFYMVTNSLTQNGERVAKISKIDKLLIDYDSEYHYLFSLLYRYSKLGERGLEEVYNLPNISRKFIECFLAFRIPNSDSLYSKIESLDYDKDKTTKIYRFIQTHSHLNNEDGVINFDMSILSETPQVITDILGLVENEDKRHYELLCESIN